MPKRNKSNAIKIGPWWIPERLVNYVRNLREKRKSSITSVIVEALEMHSSLAKALGEAVAVIHLDDNSDYQSALWEIVELLGGKDAVELLKSDSGAAYHKYHELLPY